MIDCYGSCGSSECYGQIHDCFNAFKVEYPDMADQIDGEFYAKNWSDIYKGKWESEAAYVKFHCLELHCDLRIDWDDVPFDSIDWDDVWENFQVLYSYFSIESDCGKVHIFHNI